MFGSGCFEFSNTSSLFFLWKLCLGSLFSSSSSIMTKRLWIIQISNTSITPQYPTIITPIVSFRICIVSGSRQMLTHPFLLTSYFFISFLSYVFNKVSSSLELGSVNLLHNLQNCQTQLKKASRNPSLWRISMLDFHNYHCKIFIFKLLLLLVLRKQSSLLT